MLRTLLAPQATDSSRARVVGCGPVSTLCPSPSGILLGVQTVTTVMQPGLCWASVPGKPLSCWGNQGGIGCWRVEVAEWPPSCRDPGAYVLPATMGDPPTGRLGCVQSGAGPALPEQGSLETIRL